MGCVAAASLAFATPSSAPASPVAASSAAASNVASWVSRATKVGTAEDSRTVTVAVHMVLSNSAGLKSFVDSVSSSSSRQYGQYLTPLEFQQRFAPGAADVGAVQALLQHAGMADVTVGPLGAYVSATATVGQLRSTFHVSQDLYAYAGRTLRANKEQPTLPAGLAQKILFVEGLDDSTLLRHPYHHSATLAEPTTASAQAALASAVPKVTVAASGKAAVTPPPVAAALPSPYCNKYYGSGDLVGTLSTPADVYGAAIPWLNCGYTPQQIQAAYGLSATKYDGTGVTVAIVDAYASPTLEADGNRYAANHKLPKLVTGKNFSQIIPVGIYDVDPTEACGPQGWWEEESLDLAAVHGSAPGATILYVGARDCATSLDIALMNVLYNHLADVVTNSYGEDGESLAPGEQAADEQAFLAGAAQGMTVLFSSGDDGDLSAINGVASGSWPATSSYVTGVGGTTLLLKDAAGDKSEYGWGNYRAFLNDVSVNSAKSITTSGIATTSFEGIVFDDFAFYAGSGGGISLLEPQPAYQAGAVTVALATTLNLANGFSEVLPTLQRVSPDVAMVGDPYTGYLFGETFTIAGDPLSDSGCTPLSKTEEYCENGIGGTSLSSPLMAGVVAVMNQQRKATGEPVVGFANPLFYSLGSHGNGTTFTSHVFNEIKAPTHPVSLLRGYANNLAELRVVTVNSVPELITTTPFLIEPCSLTLCEGIDEVFNYTSQSTAGGTPAGYNDVTGLGVPYVPKLIKAE